MLHNLSHKQIHCWDPIRGLHPSCAEFNSLWPGRSEYDSKNVIFNLVLLIGIFKSSYDNVLRWMPHDFTDDKSTLVQVMAWCRQATSHYLSQCWPISLSPYGVTRPQWVNFLNMKVQVMAWCRQATSHYLSQCWPISLSPYGVTRPQWVNFLNMKRHCHFLPFLNTEMTQAIEILPHGRNKAVYPACSQYHGSYWQGIK